MLYTIVLAQNLTEQTTQCLSACPITDVNCQAKCVGTPFPDEALALKTTECYKNCGTNEECISTCRNAFVAGDGVATSNSNSTTTNADGSKKSNAMVATASTLVLAAIVFC